jgi:hypothetical protein
MQSPYAFVCLDSQEIELHFNKIYLLVVTVNMLQIVIIIFTVIISFVLYKEFY